MGVVSDKWVRSILIHWGECCAKEHKAGASSIDALGQYLVSNCAMLTYFTLDRFNKTSQVTVLSSFG